MSCEDTSADRNVEIWKIKKLIKSLELARGNGTSMISLIIPPKDQISRVSKMLADEFGTASNIKSRVNRLSVLGAITSVQHRLKLYTKGESLTLSTMYDDADDSSACFQCLQMDL
jgi:peptide chain release factor subunit 1